jgi:polyisoprenoid-binding protein YceI
MKTLLKRRNLFLAFAMIIAASVIFIRCKDPNNTGTGSVSPLNDGTPVAGFPTIDATWTHDQVHSNIQWASRYYDFSSTMLTGRVNNFDFKPKLVFNDSDLSKCQINMWAQMSTFNTGQPGRDGLGKCGLSYLGITYTDSNYNKVDPKSDTAWFHSTSIVRSGNGYIVNGTFTFNRWRAPSGQADGTPITHPMTMYLTYNGTKDFANTTGSGGKYRSGLTGTFSFMKSDYMDKTSTKQYIPFPKKADLAGNTIAANNKTYGVYSLSTGDEVDVRVNIEMYKNHQ